MESKIACDLLVSVMIGFLFNFPALEVSAIVTLAGFEFLVV